MKEELGKNKEEREEKESGRPTLLTRGSDLNRSGFSRYPIYEWIRGQEDFDIAIHPLVKNDSKTRTKEGSKEGRERENETGPEQRS